MDKKFKDDTFLARWLSGQLSDQELEEFKSHQDFEVYKKIAETSANFQNPDWDKKKAWESLHQKTVSGPTKKKLTKTRIIRPWWKYAAAASLLLLVAFFFLFQNDPIKTYATAMAQQEVITLPDGSTIQLNAASKITFDQEQFLQDRSLDLEGEAFFKVKKGNQFTVQTKNGDVRVLGTSFNVRSRKNNLELVCYTGKVGLSFDQFANMNVLEAGNKITAQDLKIIQKTSLDQQEKIPSWTSGQSRFERADFVEVIEELERQFAVKIEYPTALNKLPKYNGGFPHDNLETALNIIFSPVGYRYKINNKKVVIFK